MLDFRVTSYLQCKKPSNCCSHHHSQSWLSPVIKQSCPWCPGLFIFFCLLTYWSKNARGPGQTGENTQENGQEAYCLEAWRWGMQSAWLWRATKRQSKHVIGWAHWRHRTCRHSPSEPEQETDAKGGIILETWGNNDPLRSPSAKTETFWRLTGGQRSSLSRKPATEIESMNRYLFTIKWPFIINFMCNTENNSCVHIDLWKTHVKLQTDSQPVCYTGICRSL